jgi:hypothetical protein
MLDEVGALTLAQAGEKLGEVRHGPTALPTALPTVLSMALQEDDLGAFLDLGPKCFSILK